MTVRPHKQAAACAGAILTCVCHQGLLRYPSLQRLSAPHHVEALGITSIWTAGEAAVNSGQALAYLSDYSTLQYYQTQLDCRLEVCPVMCASLLGHARTVVLPVQVG